MKPDPRIALYQEMADLTAPECAKCRVPHSCCHEMYCLDAERYAKEKFGITLERTDHPKDNPNRPLPFMGPKGCTVPPYLRPICTVHTCDINNLGFHRSDQKWTKVYFKLRAKLEDIELKDWEESHGK